MDPTIQALKKIIDSQAKQIWRQQVAIVCLELAMKRAHPDRYEELKALCEKVLEEEAFKQFCAPSRVYEAVPGAPAPTKFEPSLWAGETDYENKKNS